MDLVFQQWNCALSSFLLLNNKHSRHVWIYTLEKTMRFWYEVTLKWRCSFSHEFLFFHCYNYLMSECFACSFSAVPNMLPCMRTIFRRLVCNKNLLLKLYSVVSREVVNLHHKWTRPVFLFSCVRTNPTLPLLEQCELKGNSGIFLTILDGILSFSNGIPVTGRLVQFA